MSKTSQSPRSKLLWSLLSVAIAAATIGAIVSQGRAFSLDAFGEYISELSFPWLVAAAASMLGYILFEGEAVIAVCNAFGYHAGHKSGFIYATSDIYFSAITPSASGGQPACAYFMIKDRIPPVVSAIALLINLTMYIFSILILGFGCLILHPEIFLTFELPAKILILLGYGIQILLAAFFLMLLIRGSLLHAICRKLLHLLCKIRLLKHEEERQNRLSEHMREYASYVQMIQSHKPVMVKALLYNVLQRTCVICVPLFVFLSSNGSLAKAGSIWAVQCYTVIGSNSIPIPGAMGVSDYIMLDGFSKLLPNQNVIHFELLSRSLSFYICVILCGAATLIAYFARRRRDKRRQ